MTTRITFGTDLKQFNGLSKKAYATLSNSNDVIGQLTLNQFREISARFFGYNSKHEMSQPGSVNKKLRLTEISHVDALHLQDMQARIIELWPNDTLSKKAPFESLAIEREVWSALADTYEALFSSFVTPRRHYVLLPVIANSLFNLPSRVDVDAVSEVIKQASGLDVTYLPERTQHRAFSLFEHEEGLWDNDYPFNLQDGEVDADTFRNEYCLDLALELTYLWFECEFDGTEENQRAYSSALQKHLKSISSSINEEPDHHFVALTDALLLSANEAAHINEYYFFEGERLSLKSLNANTVDEKEPKYIQLINRNVCAGYVYFNHDSVRLYLPTFDKLDYSLSCRGELVDSLRTRFYPVVSGYNNVGYFDIAEAATVYDDIDDTPYWPDAFEKPSLPLEIIDFLPLLNEEQSRNSSLLAGNVISNPRYLRTSPLLSEYDYWGDFVDEDSDGLDYSHVSHRTYPTASACKNPNGQFAIQSNATELTTFHDASSLVITKMISHNDGSVFMIIADVYDNDEYVLATESFSFYNVNPKADRAGFDNCPIESALHSIAMKQGWEVYTVECENEWYEDKISSLTQFAGVPISEVRSMNTRSGAITILTNDPTSGEWETKVPELTQLVKDVILKFGPHSASDGSSMLDIDVEIEPVIFYLSPLLQLGTGSSTLWEAFLDEGMKITKEENPYALQKQYPFMLKRQRGAVTFFFNITGSTTDMDEVFIGCRHMFMPKELIQAFGGDPKRDCMPGEVADDDYREERARMLKLFGVNPLDSKVILRLHK